MIAAQWLVGFVALAASLPSGSVARADEGTARHRVDADVASVSESRASGGLAPFAAASLEDGRQGDRVPRDPGCLISVKDVARLQADGDVVLVDIRDARAFGRYRIAGSLNIEPGALKTKPFLRGRRVVLVDSGHSYGHLEALCRSLRDGGFGDLAILDGGLSAWRAEVGRLEGDLQAQRELSRISPAAFFQERRYSHWVVVDLDETESAAETDSMPSEGQRAGGKIDAVRRRLEAAKAGAAGGGSTDPYLLAVTADGAGWDTFLAALQGTGLVHAYFLEGGRQGYERFLGSQQPTESGRRRVSNRKACERVE